MPRKPNYRFERHERQRLKAEKKAAKQQAKAERKNAEDGDSEPTEADAESVPENPANDSSQQNG